VILARCMPVESRRAARTSHCHGHGRTTVTEPGVTSTENLQENQRHEHAYALSGKDAGLSEPGALKLGFGEKVAASAPGRLLPRPLSGSGLASPGDGLSAH
jgi:hypothetical protein